MQWKLGTGRFGKLTISSKALITPIGKTYAQWVRGASRRIMQGLPDKPISLFDSSMDEPTDLLREIIEDAFSEPVTDRYTGVFTESNPFVVEALAARYAMRVENILCTTGATGALSLIYRAFLKRGDHVIAETPGFDIFADFAQAFGARVSTFIRRHPTFEIDLDAIMAKVETGTKFIVFSNLHNPSGALVEDNKLIALAEAAAARDVIVVVDEVYRDYANFGGPYATASKLHPNIVSISSLTKIYGLSTLRCGWIMADAGILRHLRAVGEKYDFGVSKLSHAVAALVLERAEVFDAVASKSVANGRPVIIEFAGRFEEEGLVSGTPPEHGCVWFPRIIGVGDTHHFSEWLATEHGVIVAPGECFGAPGFVRIGFASAPDMLRVALTRFHQGLRGYMATPVP